MIYRFGALLSLRCRLALVCARKQKLDDGKLPSPSTVLWA